MKIMDNSNVIVVKESKEIVEKIKKAKTKMSNIGTPTLNASLILPFDNEGPIIEIIIVIVIITWFFKTNFQEKIKLSRS